MRDILIHDYFGVDYSIVWNTCKYSLPEFKEQLTKVKERMEIERAKSK